MARLAHFPAAASWSQVYLLLLGALFEHELQAPFEQVNRHLPVMEREEQEVPLWETTEQFAVAEGEMSEQKAAWTAGEGGGGGVGVGAGEGGGALQPWEEAVAASSEEARWAWASAEEEAVLFGVGGMKRMVAEGERRRERVSFAFFVLLSLILCALSLSLLSLRTTKGT